MNSWIKQMGHPVINIKILDNQAIILNQKHFLIDPNSKPLVQSDYKLVIYYSMFKFIN